MGMFDWLFRKKATGSSMANAPTPAAGAATAVAPEARPAQLPTLAPPTRPANLVETLLQRCKELPPNDPTTAAHLLKEMLQAALTLPTTAERTQELEMALDSMARHYPDALEALALGHSDPGVRERATRLLAQRKDPRAIRPALQLARTPAASRMRPLLQGLLENGVGHLSLDDLNVLSRLENQEVDFGPVRQLATRELRQRQEQDKPQPRQQDRLQRWRETAARSWVEARRGQWNHQDWLELLDSIRKSEYGPLSEEEVGRTLEELKVEFLARQQR